jgi:hypothetical protein
MKAPTSKKKPQKRTDGLNKGLATSMWEFGFDHSNNNPQAAQVHWLSGVSSASRLWGPYCKAFHVVLRKLQSSRARESMIVYHLYFSTYCNPPHPLLNPLQGGACGYQVLTGYLLTCIIDRNIQSSPVRDGDRLLQLENRWGRE